jgi:Protein of unknown function (DUF3455)
MFCSVVSFLAIVLVAVSAAPWASHEDGLPITLSKVVTPPEPVYLRAAYLGYGTQNFTCNATSGTYITSSGTAEAVLLDLTPYYDGSKPVTSLPAISELTVVGKHYFVPNPISTGVVPMFVSWGHRGFFVGTKNASLPSTQPSYSVADLLLQKIDDGYKGGHLADWVVRTDVVGGVPPTVLNNCVPGETIAIPYKAHYLFYKLK